VIGKRTIELVYDGNLMCWAVS